MMGIHKEKEKNIKYVGSMLHTTTKNYPGPGHYENLLEDLTGNTGVLRLTSPRERLD